MAVESAAPSPDMRPNGAIKLGNAPLPPLAPLPRKDALEEADDDDDDERGTGAIGSDDGPNSDEPNDDERKDEVSNAPPMFMFIFMPC